MREDQIDLSTTERQLLFDIRSGSRKTNELLSALLEKQDVLSDLFPKLFEALCQIANGIEQKKEVKKPKLPKVAKTKTAATKDKPKRGKNDAKNK